MNGWSSWEREVEGGRLVREVGKRDREKERERGQMGDRQAKIGDREVEQGGSGCCHYEVTNSNPSTFTSNSFQRQFPSFTPSQPLNYYTLIVLKIIF